MEMVTSIHAGIFNSAQRAITFHFRSLFHLCLLSAHAQPTNTNNILPSSLCSAYMYMHARTHVQHNTSSSYPRP